MLNIIETALTHGEGLFSEPLEPCNPYTNIKFSKLNLWNIYYQCLNSTIKIPMIFNLFMKSNFRMDKFMESNYPYVKDILISNYVKNINDEDKLETIMDMLDDIRSGLCEKEIIENIHVDFQNIIVSKKYEWTYGFLVDCIPHFLFCKYSCNPTKKFLNNSKLIKKMNFLKNNDEEEIHSYIIFKRKEKKNRQNVYNRTARENELPEPSSSLNESSLAMSAYVPLTPPTTLPPVPRDPPPIAERPPTPPPLPSILDNLRMSAMDVDSDNDSMPELISDTETDTSSIISTGTAPRSYYSGDELEQEQEQETVMQAARISTYSSDSDQSSTGFTVTDEETNLQ